MKLRKLSEKNPISIYFKIAFLTNHYRDPTNKAIEKEYDLTRPEFAVLFCLSQMDMISAIDVADLTQLPQNSLSRGAKRLLEKKLISTAPDANDKRRNLLSITVKGRRIANDFTKLLIDANKRLTSCLTKSESVEFERLLTKVCDATDLG